MQHNKIIMKIKNKPQKINTYKIKIKLNINIEKFLFKTFFISNENSIIEKMPTTIRVNSKTGLYFNINRDKIIRNREVWILLFKFLVIILNQNFF